MATEFDWKTVTASGSEVMSKLNSVWREMGLSEEEISLQVVAMQKQIESIFQSKLNDEMSLKEEYVNLSETLAAEIQKLATETLKVEHLVKEIPEEENVDLMRRLTWLRKEQEALHKIREERLAQIEPMQDSLFQLWRELGQEPDEEFVEIGDQITAERIEAFEVHLVVLKQEKNNRVHTLKDICNKICALFDELEYEVTTPLDVEISLYHRGEGETDGESTRLGLSNEIIQQLNQRHKDLLDEKISRTERLKQFGSQIQPLWELLQVDTSERHKFFVENTGLGMKVIEKCEVCYTSLSYLYCRLMKM